MAAAFTQFYASGMRAPGGFTLAIGLDAKNKKFLLTDRGVAVSAKLNLDAVVPSGNDYNIEFDSIINKDLKQPCHVKVQIRRGPTPPENAAFWLVTGVEGETLMDSHGTLGNINGWVLGNSGIKLEVK